MVYSNCSKENSTSRDGAGVARRAHNPKVGGSNPSPATKTDTAVDTIVSTAVSLFYRKKHR